MIRSGRRPVEDAIRTGDAAARWTGVDRATMGCRADSFQSRIAPGQSSGGGHCVANFPYTCHWLEADRLAMISHDGEGRS